MPEPSLLQAKLAHLPQPPLWMLLLQPLTTLVALPLLDSLQFVLIPLVLGRLKSGSGIFQIQPHECWEEQNSHFPWLLAVLLHPGMCLKLIPISIHTYWNSWEFCWNSTCEIWISTFASMIDLPLKDLWAWFSNFYLGLMGLRMSYKIWFLYAVFLQLGHLPNVSSLLRCFHKNVKNIYFKYLYSSHILSILVKNF